MSEREIILILHKNDLHAVLIRLCEISYIEDIGISGSYIYLKRNDGGKIWVQESAEEIAYLLNK